MHMFSLGAAAVGLGAASGLANTYLQWKNLNYQKGLQGDIFDREDSSIQRRVADLKAAGLSPVLAAGQGASAGPIVQTRAPEVPDLSNNILNAVSLLKMQQDISQSKAQERLNDITAAGKAWDLQKFKEWNLPSNASGLAKTIRDLGSLFQGSPLPGFFKGAKEGLDKVINPTPFKPLPTFDQNGRPIRQDWMDDKTWEAVKNLKRR